MLLNTRTSRLLLEACEHAGIGAALLVEPLGLNLAELVDERAKVEWRTMVLLMDQLSRVVNGDVDRLRDVGARMVHVPAYASFRRVAGAFVSVRTLYDIGGRFAAPANFPHLRLRTEDVGRDRLRIRGEVPASYVPCKAFFHIFEGQVQQLPALVDLPRAQILEARVTPSTCDLLVAIPSSKSWFARARRAARAVTGARDALAVLDEQHRELADNVAALQRARDDLRVLLDHLPDVVVVHADGVIVWANRAFLNAVGCELQDVTDRPLGQMLPLSEPSVATASGEVVLTTQRGAEVILEVSPTCPIVFDGVPAHLVVGRDVTERARMRRTLVVADRLASLGLLAAGVAHEVNNPLAYVLNNIEIAQKQLAAMGPAADVSRHALGVALEGVDRIRTIVRDLLMLSRGDEGRLRAIDVHRVVESTIALAAHDIARTAVLVSEFSPAPHVHASDARIAQVVLNLVSNALEAMRGRAREDNRLVVRVARAPQDRLLIEVSDTGGGIAEADLGRVFEPFFTTKVAGEGTGLGLSIAHRLVAEVGGEITVSSVLGRGTTFQVFLPAATSA